MGKIEGRRINRKKIVIVSIIALIIIGLIVLISLYLSKKDVRDWVDIHLLGKSLTEQDIDYISLNTDKTNQIHVYGKYIAILNDKAITLYNSYGEKVTDLEVNINTALFDSATKYLVVAEKNGNEICLILDKTYLWSATTEGEILQIHVNQNGYVAVVTTDVTHKSILTLYNAEGKKLFTSYFSSTRIIDASISNDNKYVAIGELDSSGATIKSTIKVISIDNAQKTPDNAIIETYDTETESLIANVEYQSNGQIACIYSDYASVIKDNENKEIVKIENDKITHISNNFKNHIVYIEEQSEGLFKVSSNICFVNTKNEQQIVYKMDEVAKEIYANENIIAVNAGTDLYFINTSGWLLKKYTASQEITNVKVSESLVAVIYKDKVEIISL